MVYPGRGWWRWQLLILLTDRCGNSSFATGRRRTPPRVVVSTLFYGGICTMPCMSLTTYRIT